VQEPGAEPPPSVAINSLGCMRAQRDGRGTLAMPTRRVSRVVSLGRAQPLPDTDVHGSRRLLARSPMVMSARLATKVKRVPPWRRRPRLSASDNGVSSAVMPLKFLARGRGVHGAVIPAHTANEAGVVGAQLGNESGQRHGPHARAGRWRWSGSPTPFRRHVGVTVPVDYEPLHYLSSPALIVVYSAGGRFPSALWGRTSL
jgi:hypothetical protein